MKRFARLFEELDENTGTNARVAALVHYFREAEPQDAVWALHFLCGRRPRRSVTITQLRTWCAEVADIPLWMFEECYEFVGDLAETIALLLPLSGESSTLPLHRWVEERLLPLKGLDEAAQRNMIAGAWSELDQRQRFIFNKLLTGGLRVGVSQKLVVRALSEVTQISAAVIAHRLMGHWEPEARFYRRLIDPDDRDTRLSQPYPFCLAHAVPVSVETPTAALDLLGAPDDWLFEWKWDGIRAQLIRREGQTFLWSRGEELLTDRFPELLTEAAMLPDGTVLDGEILGWKEQQVLPFSELQRRIGRSKPGARLLETVPVCFLSFDLLEDGGVDIREWPTEQRRARLEQLTQQIQAITPDPRKRQRTLFDMAEPDAAEQRPSEQSNHVQARRQMLFPGQESIGSCRILLSPRVAVNSWDECRRKRDLSRELGVEGLMLKRRNGGYAAGRVAGVWWKWKVEPWRCDAVLVYAQRGHGRRAGLYTDYTFAVWHEGELVPFAKAYSGLTDEEIEQVDRFVQQNTIERFGPVRRVTPELVFELAFEGLQISERHKSGIALRFPRILRWRTDKRPEDADSLASVMALQDSGQLNC